LRPIAAGEDGGKVWWQPDQHIRPPAG